MKNFLSIDAHSDTIYKSYRSYTSIVDNRGKTHIDIARLQAIKPHIQFLAVYADSAEGSHHFTQTIELIDHFYREAGSPGFEGVLVENRNSLKCCLDDGDLGIILAVEGAYLLEDNPHRLELLYRLGVRCLSLTWNHGNGLSGGIGDSDDRGLSQQGREIIKRMNRLGVMVDISHISKKGFWDIIDISEKPVAATHSNCHSLCAHPRNLDDRQIKAIGELKGVIGINFVPEFLGKGRNSVSGIADHIEYAVEKAGVEYVGLGSDFDGTEVLPDGIDGVNAFYSIHQELIKRGYGPQDLGKIFGGNFLRIIEDTIPK